MVAFYIIQLLVSSINNLSPFLPFLSLRLLSRGEIKPYIEHRCHIAGAANCPFDSAAIDALYEIGRGNLRATDYLALKSLEIAHDLDCDVLDSNHIAQAKRMLWN